MRRIRHLAGGEAQARRDSAERWTATQQGRCVPADMYCVPQHRARRHQECIRALVEAHAQACVTTLAAAVQPRLCVALQACEHAGMARRAALAPTSYVTVGMLVFSASTKAASLTLATTSLMSAATSSRW